MRLLADRRNAGGALCALCLLTSVAGAQDVLARALDLERQGRLQEAATAFRVILQRAPASPAGLLGAERVYALLGWRDSLLPLVETALRLDPADATARSIELRTAQAAGGTIQAARVLQRWIDAAPRSETPYREMVRLLLAAGRYEDARTTLEVARERLGDPTALQPEMAQLEVATGNWPRAATEWRMALLRQPGLGASAAFALQAAPVAVRERLLRVLTEGDSAVGPRRVAAELLVGWNEPERAWAMLRSALPRERSELAAVLRGFVDRARAQPGEAAQRVAGAALEQLAAALPPSEASSWRIEAARAYAEAGDGAAARRVLRVMADDPNAPASVAVSAATTLIGLHVREGNPAEAERLLEQDRGRLPGSEVGRLALAVARAWIARGMLGRAEAAVRAESSLAGDEIRGWVALYRGNLAAARELLRGAGARPAEGAAATERAATLVLLQGVEADSLPALGAALLLAARGDTAAAARALAQLAHGPALPSGRPEVLAWAARYAAAARDGPGAERLWGELLERHAASPQAPAAQLALARALAARGDTAGATQRLEALILTYPESALVPEARRELDRVRNLVPRS
jgi:tetratricopeptide (TPR) repeat protein